MKKLLVCLVLGSVILSTGCTGTFGLTRKIHNWQTSFENRWVDEAAFLGCVILPVYGLSTLGDALIFNSIEFWTGNNPMHEALKQGDGPSVVTRLKEDGAIRFSCGSRHSPLSAPTRAL